MFIIIIDDEGSQLDNMKLISHYQDYLLVEHVRWHRPGILYGTIRPGKRALTPSGAFQLATPGHEDSQPVLKHDKVSSCLDSLTGLKMRMAQ